MMETLDVRLMKSLSEIEKKLNVKLTQVEKESVREGIFVGHQKQYTYDYAVKQMEERVESLFSKQALSL